MKNQEGLNRGRNRKNISLYSLAKTLKERFPDYYKIVLESHREDTPPSMIPDFIAWYEKLQGTEQEFENEEIKSFGLFPNAAEYRYQLIISVVVLFHFNYFETKNTFLRKGIRTRLAAHFNINATSISHMLGKMRFENGEVVPYWKPMINSAKIIAETFCLERGIDKQFEIEDALVLQHEADEWMLGEVMRVESDNL